MVFLFAFVLLCFVCVCFSFLEFNCLGIEITRICLDDLISYVLVLGMLLFLSGL